MITISALTQEQLYQPATSAELLQYGEELFQHRQSREARELAEKLEHILPSPTDAGGEIYRQYAPLMHRLYYSALPNFFTDEEVTVVFRIHVADMLRDLGYPWGDRLRAKLLTVPQTRRDAVKEKMRKALYQNEERLTSPPLITAEGKEMSGTIGNWLRDYFSYTSGERADTLTHARYFTESKNVQNLSLDEKRAVERLVALYERLKIPAASSQGTEEEILFRDAEGRLIDFNKGNFVELDTGKSVIDVRLPPLKAGATIGAVGAVTPPPSFPRSAPSPLEDVTAVIRPQPSVSRPLPSIRVAQDAKREQGVREAKERLRGKGGDVVMLFFNVIASPTGTNIATPDELIAGVTILVEDNALERAITDAKISELFLAFLRSKNQPDLLEGSRLAPAMPKYMSLFLQWVLQEKGKLSEHDAAQEGARLANILKKKHGNEKYSRIAYFDAQTQRFKWS